VGNLVVQQAHWVYFTSINKAAWLFRALFIVQGILFVILGIFQNKLSCRLWADNYGITGIALILFSLIIYPLLGYFIGHVHPSSPTFGLPCLTAIFTFGFLLLNIKHSPPAILVIPLTWSLIGCIAVFQFGILEDAGLIVAGLITVSLIINRNKRVVKNNEKE
jgi:Family of unknown function (DUF6064)